VDFILWQILATYEIYSQKKSVRFFRKNLRENFDGKNGDV